MLIGLVNGFLGVAGSKNHITLLSCGQIYNLLEIICCKLSSEGLIK